MRVEKQIALLLSGAILAGSLAGCSRTIIEHQFHTNTVTDVEYITENTGTNLDGVYNLQKFFLPYGITVNIILDPLCEMDEDDSFDEAGGIDNAPDLEKAQNFLMPNDSTSDSVIYYTTKCDEDPASWLTAYSKAANMFYDLFIRVEDEIWTDDIKDWSPSVSLVGVPTKQEDEYYMHIYIFNDFTESI